MYGIVARLLCAAGLVVIASPLGAVDIDLVNRTSIAALQGTNGRSFEAHGLSDDGRYALLVSEADNLIAGDTNQAADLFLYDHASGSLERVSLGNGGAQADADTRRRADLSGDARHVVFESRASNLVAADTHDTWQIYLRDRVAQTTTLVSRGLDGSGSATGSHAPQISADGRYIVFVSSDPLVAQDLNASDDVYRYDRDSGVLDVVSVSITGDVGNLGSDDARISADGRYVAFRTQATNLFAGDTNGDSDIVLRDTVGNVNVNASIAPDGGQFGGQPALASGNAVSADGRYVLFNTDAALEPADLNAAIDGFRFDRVTQQSLRVTRDAAGGVLQAGAVADAVSADGNVILMRSRDTDLAGSSSHGSPRHYMRDVTSGSIVLVKLRPGWFNPYDSTEGCDLSGDGGVAYCSSSDDALTDGDGNSMDDVFRSVIGAEGGTRISQSLPDAIAAANADSGISYGGGVSEDGRFVVFSSLANNLVVGDTNGVADVFLRDRLAGTTQRISRRIYGGESPCGTITPRITPDGRYVVFMGCYQLWSPFWGWGPPLTYRYDRLTDQLEAVNGSGASFDPSISDDGNVIAFSSAGSSGIRVIVHRLSDGLTAVASQPPGGGTANGLPGIAQISGDGRTVYFSATSSNLVAGDTNGVQDVFAYSVDTATLERVSLGPAGEELAEASWFLGVSRDGRHFAFENTDLVCPSSGSLHLRDTLSGRIDCVGHDVAAGIVYAYRHQRPVGISADGDRVAFSTPLPSSYPGAPVEAIMLFDRTTQRVHRITPEGMNGDARVHQLSADGGIVMFSSTASNVVPDDPNNHIRDVFVAERLTDALFADDFETQ
ncbi:MAG TPA: hypothetical protein VLF18_18115 [Tahibacter sp.]|uniref:hypothetical protein n=1 Tax=Tahibacter sp. TaxID=2056211 RepID=UPI002BB6FD24|nr:hypothetical protein [Tahibacter sp.]HSX62102.1 hypothetical protein [Tahibacter sp.]